MPRSFSDFQAFILVGPGHALAPVADPHLSPKWSLQVGNIPMMAHLLNWLADSQITNLFVLCPARYQASLSGMIEQRCQPNLRLDLIPCENEDSEGFGTIAKLHQIKPYVRGNFMLLPCDLLTDAHLGKMADLHRSGEALVTCMLAPSSKEESERIVVGLDTPRIVVLEENTGTLSVPGGLLFRHPKIVLRTDLRDAHCYMFRQDIFDYLEPGMYSVREELIPALVKAGNQRVHAYVLDETQRCLRVNTFANLMKANQLQLPPKKDTAVLAAPDVQIADKTSTCKRSILGTGVKIGKSCKIANCVLMSGTHVEDGCKLEGVTTGPNVSIQRECKLRDCRIGPGYSMPSGTEAQGEFFSVHDEIP